MAAMVAAMAEATADTVSAELGQVLGGTPWMITSLRRVPAGTDGAVSLLGTLAGAVAAAVLVGVLAAIGPALEVLEARRSPVAPSFLTSLARRRCLATSRICLPKICQRKVADMLSDPVHLRRCHF